MTFNDGVRCHWQGLKMGLRVPRLLVLGLIRLAAVVVLAVAAAVWLVGYTDDLMNLLWSRPEVWYLVWIWILVSWGMAVVLASVAVLVSYLVTQMVFAVVIMDWMSRITERLETGDVVGPVGQASVVSQFLYLVSQEVPRTLLPLLIAAVLIVAGWLTPIGPIITLASSALAAAFLAWDNTDLMPARRMIPFGQRWVFFKTRWVGHLGFGIWFLVPVLNIVCLSFAPVGGTLFYLQATTQPRRSAQ